MPAAFIYKGEYVLNISSDSWHYRLRARVFQASSKDLCSYFWSVVAAALALASFNFGKAVFWVIRPAGRLGRFQHAVPILVITLTATLVFIVLGLIAYALWTNPYGFLIELLKSVGLFLIVVIIIILGVGTVLGIVELSKHHAKVHKVNYKPEHQESKGASTLRLIWNFLKAKKRKACPLISIDGKYSRIRPPV